MSLTRSVAVSWLGAKRCQQTNSLGIHGVSSRFPRLSYTASINLKIPETSSRDLLSQRGCLDVETPYRSVIWLISPLQPTLHVWRQPILVSLPAQVARWVEQGGLALLCYMVNQYVVLIEIEVSLESPAHDFANFRDAATGGHRIQSMSTTSLYSKCIWKNRFASYIQAYRPCILVAELLEYIERLLHLAATLSSRVPDTNPTRIKYHLPSKWRTLQEWPFRRCMASCHTPWTRFP